MQYFRVITNALACSAALLTLLFIGRECVAQEHTNVNQRSFAKGEVLEFKLELGLIPVGKAQMATNDKYYKINGRDCFKIDIQARTSGLIEWIAPVDDSWGGYLDTVSLLPHMAYRDLSEGNFRKKEFMKFDHTTEMIEVKEINTKTGQYKQPKYYKMPYEPMFDLVSSLFYLRTVDYTGLSMGDTLVVPVYYEDHFYDFSLIYFGKDRVQTRAGWYNALMLVPIIPENDILPGEHPVTAWVSDDANHVPLRVEAEMWVGSVAAELIKATGLRNPPNLVLGKGGG